MYEFLNSLTQLNLPTMLAVVVSAWFFTRDIKKEIHEIRQDIKDIHKDMKEMRINMHKDMKEMREDMHKDMKEMREDMHKEFKFTNIRLSRVEGTVYGKDIYKTENSE